MREATELRLLENAEALLRNYSQDLKSRMLGTCPDGKPSRDYHDRHEIYFHIRPYRMMYRLRNLDDYKSEYFVHRDLVKHVELDWDIYNSSRCCGNFSIDMYHVPYSRLSSEEQMIELNKKLQATREFFDNKPELLTNRINEKLNNVLEMSNEITNKINTERRAQEVYESNSELDVDLKSLADNILQQKNA